MVNTQTIQKIVTTPNQNAIDALTEACDLTKAELKLCFSKGAVWLTSGKQKPVRLRRVKKALTLGDKIELYYNSSVLNSSVPAPTLLLDNKQYSIWLKPRGMLSQGSKWGDFSALYRWVEMNHVFENETQSRQAWLVHRLDRATAGLQVLAHSKKMAQTLTKLFENHQIKKRYQAIVHGQFPEDRQTYQDDIDGKSATTHVVSIQFSKALNVSLVEVEIESGRKHQIRKHLSQAGFAIVGDRLYGDATLDNNVNPERPDLQLTAYRLQFECPLTLSPIDVQLSADQLDLITLAR